MKKVKCVSFIYQSSATSSLFSCQFYLEVSRALDREDEDDEAISQEGLGEFVLIAWCSRPDPFLLGNFYIPDVAALHNEVSDR